VAKLVFGWYWFVYATPIFVTLIIAVLHFFLKIKSKVVVGFGYTYGLLLLAI